MLLSLAMSTEKKPIQFIHDLMEGKSKEEILEAEENFRDFLKFMWKITVRRARERNNKRVKRF